MEYTYFARRVAVVASNLVSDLVQELTDIMSHRYRG